MRFATLIFLLQIGSAAALLLTVYAIAECKRLIPGETVGGGVDAIRSLELALPVAFALAAIVAALAARLAARLIVVRLNRAVARLGAACGGDLTCRSPAGKGGDVFAVLTDAINAALDHTQRSMQQFTLSTDMLAHDLRSPLTRLQCALDRAALAALSPDARETIDHARTEGRRLTRVIDAALQITRAEVGMGREAFACVDLSRLLEEIAEIYGPTVEDAGRAIVVVIPHKVVLPKPMIHRDLMTQALGNLVDNALKHGAGTVELALTAERYAVTVTVCDEGTGIPFDRHELALRRLGRIDYTRNDSGSGLGLSLVAAVARLHGGEITLDGDNGLRVALRLPVSEGRG